LLDGEAIHADLAEPPERDQPNRRGMRLSGGHVGADLSLK
jgi:hypothetical protein